MKKIIPYILLLLSVSVMVPRAHALEINLLNVDLGSRESQQAADLYGNAYGFAPAQVMPAMLGPAEEVPAILRIAQAAGTVPLSVWMMRKMGMGYGRILENFALSPTALLGSAPVAYQPGYYSPTWSRVMNPVYVQSSRLYFLRDMLRVDPVLLPRIPTHGVEFTRAILNPYYPGRAYYQLPPGQAKKLGLWMPPGQAKKMGKWYPYGYGNGIGEVDDDHGKEKWEIKGNKVKYEAKWDDKKGKDKGQFKEGHGKGHGKGK